MVGPFYIHILVHRSDFNPAAIMAAISRYSVDRDADGLSASAHGPIYLPIVLKP
jgi:hypothetical protein